MMLYAGESREKEKLAAAAAIILLPNGRRLTISQLLTVATTTEADYQALIIGLRKARKLGLQGIEIKGHSEVVFNQINGLVEVRSESLQLLMREAKRLLRTFDRATVELISAEQNRPARKALYRCFAEVLGHSATSATHPRKSLTAEILNLIQLGDQAKKEDYLVLGSVEDDLAQLSLDKLRPKVPLAVQDLMALQWNGDETELTQMYRWYLRGLPPNLAIGKVVSERTSNPGVLITKLPWEGQLREEVSMQIETGDIFDATLEPIFLADMDDETSPISIIPPASPAPLDPLDPLDFSLEDVFLSNVTPDSDAPAAGFFQNFLDPFSTAGEELDDQKLRDRVKDTLPSVDRVQQILGMIMHLSETDKTRLVQELTQFTEITNRWLQAIANDYKRP